MVYTMLIKLDDGLNYFTHFSQTYFKFKTYIAFVFKCLSLFCYNYHCDQEGYLGAIQVLRICLTEMEWGCQIF